MPYIAICVLHYSPFYVLTIVLQLSEFFSLNINVYARVILQNNYFLFTGHCGAYITFVNYLGRLFTVYYIYIVLDHLHTNISSILIVQMKH